MSITDFSLRLLAAIAAGILIGIEREWQNKSAGIRTNTLVSVGSALYVILSIQMTETNGDVTRIIGQVVTGIGFLGAGIIFKEGINIHGLTTAATVWCASAIGCTAAAGYFTETLIGTLLVISVNLFTLPFDKLIDKIKKKRIENREMKQIK
ncbi:MAG TPA: MgtC/SapB family protein [Paludibacter sp.]|nr:MgtC/SapB family protein [Paludibacter sp.]